MTLADYVDERSNGGKLDLFKIRNVLKIENERFIIFNPVSDEKANEYFNVNFVVEALAIYLKKGGDKNAVPNSPEKSVVRKIHANIRAGMITMKECLPEYLVFVMEV